jgi:deoxyribonuclease V
MSKPTLDIPDMPRCLDDLLTQVPPGWVTTYRALAAALGNTIANRWVAEYVHRHRHDGDCPCHRVVRVDGQLSTTDRDDGHRQRQRLEAEGVEVGPDGVDLERYGFDRFVGPRPLERLLEDQRLVEAAVSLEGPPEIPPLVAGVDLSYPSEKEAVGAYALIETSSRRLVWSTLVRRGAEFPYIPSYLSYRELPVLLALIETARVAGRLADAVMVDGTGVLHPRRAGIATHLGVLTDVPTIGVTKSLLVGQVDLDAMATMESRPIVHESEVVGKAIRLSPRSRRPVFVSPGHRMSLAIAEAVVRQTAGGRRLPEPTYWADRLSREASRRG